MGPTAQAAVLPLFDRKGQPMHVIPRLNEIMTLLQSHALGEITLSAERLQVALKLLDLATDDDPPPDGGEEVSAVADAPAVLVFAPRIAA
jgi:hypothetical protein